MKFEALLLRVLCGTGMLISVAVFGAMLFATPATNPAATSVAVNTAHHQAVACGSATSAH